MSSLLNRRTATLICKYAGYFQNFHKSPYKYHYYSFSTSSTSSTSTTPQAHHYKTLNIESTASEEDIRRAYNNLMKQWHPDLYMNKPPTEQQQAQTKFLLIREAFQIIIAHKQGLNINQQIDKDKMDKHKMNRGKHSSANFTYYSWAKKVHETQENAENIDVDGENEETAEKEEKQLKYSETYKQNKTWIGKGIEELYDWIIFLYQRNPSWMQFFLIATCCFGVVQGIWHLFNPTLNDHDPDRIWNVWRGNKPKTGMSGYLPSSSAAISSTPNLVALQPHFKGYTLYDNTTKEDENKDIIKRKSLNDDEFKDIEKKNSFQLFANLNLDSTVNKGDFKKRQKKKKNKGDIEIKVIELEIDGKTAKKSKKIINRDELGESGTKKQKKEIIDYNDIPLELRSSPMGVLLASNAFQNDNNDNDDNNNQYDWTKVIEKYREINLNN